MVDRKKNPPNPTGKGGLGERPQDIGNGRPKHSPQYWLNQYGKLSYAELKKLIDGLKSGALDEELTVNQTLALRHIAGAVKFDNRKDLLNRVDGMPTQRTELTGSDGGGISFIIKADGYRNPKHIENDATSDNSITGPNEVQGTDLAQEG